MTDPRPDIEPPTEDDDDDDDDDSSPLSLRPHIYFPGVVCLNESVPDSGASILKVPDEQDTPQPSLRSPPDDAELLLLVPFLETVTIHSIRIGRHPGASSAPRRIKVFVDRDDLDFETARELQPPEACIELPPPPKGSSIVTDTPVLPGRFRDVSSVTLLFASNHQSGQEQSSTEVTYVGFVGESTHRKRLPVTYAVHESQARLEHHDVHAEGIGAVEGHGFHY